MRFIHMADIHFDSPFRVLTDKKDFGTKRRLEQREAFRKALDNCYPVAISKYDDNKINILLQNKNIIRSRRKIEATINNALVFLDIKKEWGTFSKYIWHFTTNNIIKNTSDNLKTTSPLSDEVSLDLRKRGMKYTGSTIIYSYLQAIGIINAHDLNCYKYQKD